MRRDDEIMELKARIKKLESMIQNIRSSDCPICHGKGYYETQSVLYGQYHTTIIRCQRCV